MNILYASIVHIFLQLSSKTCLFFFFRYTLFMIDHDCSHSLSFPSFSQKVIYIIIHDENMPFPIKILAPFIHKLFKLIIQKEQHAITMQTYAIDE